MLHKLQQRVLNYYQESALQIYITNNKSLDKVTEKIVSCLIDEWNINGDAVFAALFIRIRREDLEAWEKVNVLLDNKIVNIVDEWYRLFEVTKTPYNSSSLSRNFSLKLRELMRLSYINLPLVLLVLAEHRVAIAQISDYLETKNSDEKLLWQETNDVFIPLLEMLGIWEIRQLWLENSLRSLHFEAYNRIERHSKSVIEAQKKSYFSIKQKLDNLFDLQDLKVQVYQIDATLGSIYINQYIKGMLLNDQLNYISLEILTLTQEDCYRVLNTIHHLGIPIRGSFSDYIAMPQPNGYQAILTSISVHISDKHRIQINCRICTQGMKKLNTWGIILAKYQDPEHYKNCKAWWNESESYTLISSLLTSYPIENFLNISYNYIYCFTPQGEVKLLKKGSTAIDFAYDVHSEIGHHCRSIKVNGILVSHGTELSNGDLIELIHDPLYPGPHPSWLHLARNSGTRQQIKKALFATSIFYHEGQKRLQRYLNSLEYEAGFVVHQQQLVVYLAKVAEELNLGDIFRLFDAIMEPSTAKKSFSVDKLIGFILESELIGAILYPDETHVVDISSQKPTYKKPIIRFCPRCKPTPASPIVLQKVFKKSEVQYVLHRTKVPDKSLFGMPKKAKTLCVKDYSNLSGDYLPVKWGKVSQSYFAVNITIVAADQPGLVGRILEPVYRDPHVSLIKVQATADQEGVADIWLTVECRKKEQAYELQANLTALAGIFKVSIWPLSSTQGAHLKARHLGNFRNPYSCGVPIVDERMFFGRETQLNKITTHLDSKFPARLIILHGHRRSGKTSLAQQLIKKMQFSSNLFVYVDLEWLGDTLTPSVVYHEIVESIKEQLSERFESINSLDYDIDAFRSNPGHTLMKYLTQLQDLFKAYRIIVIFDEFNILIKKNPSSPIYRHLRAVTVSPNLQNITFLPIIHTVNYLNSSANALLQDFFSQGNIVEVEMLDPISARKLVEEPLRGFVEYDTEVINKIVNSTDGNPYLIHIICYGIINMLTEQERSFVRNEDLQEIVSCELMRKGQTYFNFLLRPLAEVPNSLDVVITIAELQDQSSGWAESPKVYQSCGFQQRLFDECIYYLQLYNIIRIRNVEDKIQELRITNPYFSEWVKENSSLVADIVGRLK